MSLLRNVDQFPHVQHAPSGSFRGMLHTARGWGGGGGGGEVRRREEKRREGEKHTQQHSFTRPGVGGGCLVVDGQVVVVLDQGGSVPS